MSSAIAVIGSAFREPGKDASFAFAQAREPLIDGGAGEGQLGRIGVDVGATRDRRRGFALVCLDWTERRSHLAGALGAELCDRLFELGWVERRGSGRAVAVTEAGSAGLWELLELEFERSA